MSSSSLSPSLTAFIKPLKPLSKSPWRKHVSVLRGGGQQKQQQQKPPSTPSCLEASSSSSAPLAYNASSIDAGSTPVTTLMENLQSNIETGLFTHQVQARLQQFGPNALQPSPKPSLFELIAEQFQDRLVQILLVVALVSAIFSVLEHTSDQSILSSFVEPLVILAILILNAAVGVWQSQSASDSLDALLKMQPTLSEPLRDGEWQANVPAAELVPGDIVKLRVGDKVPADARLLSLSSSTFMVDETSLTGESVTVSKLIGAEGQSDPGASLQSQHGMVFSGSMVTRGTGLAVVVQTGQDTQFGKIQQGVATAETPKTPLAIQLDEFGETLTVVIGVICLAVWLVSIPKMNDSSFDSIWQGAIYYAKVAVALGVAAIPEGKISCLSTCIHYRVSLTFARTILLLLSQQKGYLPSLLFALVWVRDAWPSATSLYANCPASKPWVVRLSFVPIRLER